MSPRRSLFILIILSLISLSACSEYWWTRGQPPSVESLVSRANDRLERALASNSESRAQLAPLAKDIKTELLSAFQILAFDSNLRENSQLIAHLEKAREDFINLEGKLSFGSRPAYGELSGQFRAFEGTISPDDRSKLSFSSFGLFVSRTLFFLANELSVPAPA